MTVEKGCNAVIYLGNVELNSVTVNGKQLTDGQFKVENLMLTIFADYLSDGNNSVVVNGDKTVSITVVQ